MFVETYPQYVDGLILSGTGMYPLWKGLPTVKVLQLITKIYGAEKRVEWVNQLVSNSFNKKIRPLRTQSDWISSNAIEVDNFIKDHIVDLMCQINYYIKQPIICYIHHN